MLSVNVMVSNMLFIATRRAVISSPASPSSTFKKQVEQHLFAAIAESLGLVEFLLSLAGTLTLDASHVASRADFRLAALLFCIEVLGRIDGLLTEPTNCLCIACILAGEGAVGGWRPRGERPMLGYHFDEDSPAPAFKRLPEFVGAQGGVLVDAADPPGESSFCHAVITHRCLLPFRDNESTMV